MSHHTHSGVTKYERQYIWIGYIGPPYTLVYVLYFEMFHFSQKWNKSEYIQNMTILIFIQLYWFKTTVCMWVVFYAWWCHQMETFSGLLALCAGNSPVPMNSPHEGQWRGAFMFSLICVWINGWVNNREAGDSRRLRGHYDVNVMCVSVFKHGIGILLSFSNHDSIYHYRPI